MDAAAQLDALQAAARRLATEQRGLDLLAGHVKAVGDLVKKLEAQVQEVVAAAGQGGTTAAAAGAAAAAAGGVGRAPGGSGGAPHR